MKKPVQKNSLQIATVEVSATLEELNSLERLVEKLSCRENDCNFESLNDEWQMIQTSSMEGYALGNLVLSEEKKSINSIFDTCFIFTCVDENENESNFKMTWVCSLS